MKLSEYKSLLDLKASLQKAAQEYYTGMGIPFTSVQIKDTQGTFVVVTRTYESKEYLQSISIWSILDVEKSGGCSACKKSTT